MFLLIVIYLSAFGHGLNISDTTNKIKVILTKYKSNRFPRCTRDNGIGEFVAKTVNFFEKTERYSDILKYSNVSECSMGASDSYLTDHVIRGLVVHEDVPHTHWIEYKSVHKKNYSSPDHEMAALSKWRKNLIRVAKHNQEFLKGKKSYSLHLNHFADLDPTGYFKQILKLVDTFPLFDPAEDHGKTTYRKNLRQTIPKHVDWRTKGFKPRREEQWKCGACYAFAITHALQAQLYKKHKDWTEISPQQIVDCSFTDGNNGCNGGSLRAALRYAAREGLLMESQYPYIGKKGRCKYNRYLVQVRPRRWASLPPGDEAAMERALATIGPIAVGVNASPYTFQLYRNGVYDDPFCLPWKLNHAMLLVGYTPEYWILLNWWGKNWGEDGYMRIRRGFNRCGVSNMATYVEL